MRRLLLATLAGSALIASAGTTGAQTISGGSGHYKSGWTTAPVAGVQNNTRRARNRHAKPRDATARRSDTYSKPASQEPMPQSPPGGY